MNEPESKNLAKAKKGSFWSPLFAFSISIQSWLESKKIKKACWEINLTKGGAVMSLELKIKRESSLIGENEVTRLIELCLSSFHCLTPLTHPQTETNNKKLLFLSLAFDVNAGGAKTKEQKNLNWPLQLFWLTDLNKANLCLWSFRQ